jgi:hypothetical protein
MVLAVGLTMALAAEPAPAKPHDNPGQGNGMGNPHGGNGNGNGNGMGGGGGECDAAVVDAVRAAVDAECPCAGTDDGAGGITPWKNHGRYVRCVAHAVRAETRAAAIKRRCVRGAVPCAARSACGKRGAVPCVTGVPDTCVGGSCSNDPVKACAVDADCTVLACEVSDPDDCTAGGGTVRSESCCFGSPSGAFLDEVSLF